MKLKKKNYISTRSAVLSIWITAHIHAGTMYGHFSFFLSYWDMFNNPMPFIDFIASSSDVIISISTKYYYELCNAIML